MKNAALTVSGLIFLAVSVGHFARYYKAVNIVVADSPVPVQWSLYGGIVFVLLALWMFIAAAKKQ